MKNVVMLYVREDSATFEKVEPSLQNYYKLLNCDCIDIVNIAIGGKKFDVICDNEALLKQPPLSFSVISSEGYPMVAGNILVCNSEDGYETDLTGVDVMKLLPAICWTMQNGEMVAALIAD